MTLASFRSKLSRSERGGTALSLVPAQTTSLADVVNSHRYAALERLCVEAYHDVHRQTRLTEHLRAAIPDLQAEHAAIDLVAKAARVSLPPVAELKPNARSTSMAELLESTVGLDYPEPVLPAAPTGEAALRRAFSALAQETRAQWSKAAHLRREVEQFERQAAEHRQYIDSALGVLTGTVSRKVDSTSNATTVAAAGGLSLQEGLTLRLRPNRIAGAIIAFLSLSILTGLLIVNSAAVTGRPLTPMPAPTTPAAAGSPGGTR